MQSRLQWICNPAVTVATIYIGPTHMRFRMRRVPYRYGSPPHVPHPNKGAKRTTGVSIHLAHCGVSRIVVSGIDSDLEAFSHNRTRGSFAALAFQPTAMANYENQLFLSY